MRSSRSEMVTNIKETNPRTAAVNVQVSLSPSMKTMFKKKPKNKSQSTINIILND